MSHDILLGTSPRGWSRDSSPAAATASPPSRTLALGGMALGTSIGLAVITRPWWSRSFSARPSRLPSRKGDPYLHVSPSGRIISNPAGARLLGAVKFPYRPRGT